MAAATLVRYRVTFQTYLIITVENMFYLFLYSLNAYLSLNPTATHNEKHVPLIFTRHHREAATMAQAPGGLSASQAAASDDGMYCKLCPSVKATAYCLHWQCKVYLCLNCAGHHKILPATASHKLLEGDKFPSFYTTGHGEDVRQCPDHPEEEIKFYCPSHDVLCCRDCNVLNKHDQCTKHYIPEISKEFLESSEYTKLTEEFHSSEDKIKDFFKKIDACLRAVESINTNVVEQFTSYKALIMAYLDQREKELLVELKTIRDRDTAALDELKATAKTIQAEHSEAHAKLRLHEDNSHDLFIATKRVQALMTKLKTSLDDIADKPWYSSVKLWKDPVVEKLLANKEGLAQIISTSGTGSFFMSDFTIRRQYTTVLFQHNVTFFVGTKFY